MGENKEFEHYKFIADKGQNPLRVDRFLMNFVEFATRNKIQQSVKAGNVRVNDKVVKSNHKVKGGDVVTIVLDYPKETNELLPQDIPIIINYEDDDLLIVNKEAGMVVHPGFGNYDGTLVNALAFHFQNLPNMGEEERPGLVHRIDKNTSGILVVAKTERAMTILAKKFEDRDLNRKYIALVWGDVKEDEGTITGNIGRSLKNRKVMDVFPDGEYGKHAVSHYKVLERFGYTTLVECKLETGRTHQIRAHFKSIGHTLFNDEEYGGDAILKGTTFTKYKQFVHNCFKICPRQALHAKSLGFEHPTTKKEVFFDSDLADDMQELIEKWRKYATHQKL
ncbi:MAG: RluA family pseudouridine synthase [Flavobacteriales bacterium]|nr:RluA family pseudouridine synthase [Flavobacteriales bacterium]